jgi:hypothetical protein
MISKLLLNGKIPTREEYEQFKQLHIKNIPTDFEIGDTWDDCTFTWANGDTLNWAAYWGLWEMRSFNRLKETYQLEIIQNMFEYIDEVWDDLVEMWEEQEEE